MLSRISSVNAYLVTYRTSLALLTPIRHPLKARTCSGRGLTRRKYTVWSQVLQDCSRASLIVVFDTNHSHTARACALSFLRSPAICQHEQFLIAACRCAIKCAASNMAKIFGVTALAVSPCLYRSPRRAASRVPERAGRTRKRSRDLLFEYRSVRK